MRVRSASGDLPQTARCERQQNEQNNHIMIRALRQHCQRS